MSQPRSLCPATLLCLAIFVASACAPSRPTALEAPTAIQPEMRDLKPGTDLYGDPLPHGAIARMGSARLKHQDGVVCVAFSPDGKTLASGSHDRTIRIWDAMTGKLLRQLEGHESGVVSVAFSPDGHLLASASNDSLVRVWKARTGEPVWTLRGHQEAAHSVVFSPDGQKLASGGADGVIRLWAVDTGVLLRAWSAHKEWITTLAFSPDGDTLASGSHDGSVRIWCAKDESMRFSIDNLQYVFSVSFSPDGKELATGASPGETRLWDTKTGRPTGQWDKCAHGVCYSPDGRLLSSVQESITLWDPLTG